jgi:hypothetical protein
MAEETESDMSAGLEDEEVVDTPATRVARALTMTSPFGAAFSVPLSFDMMDMRDRPADWQLFGSYVAFTALLNGVLLSLMIWLFNTRWRVSDL